MCVQPPALQPRVYSVGMSAGLFVCMWRCHVALQSHSLFVLHYCVLLQAISFSVMPPELRIVFVACVSFVWLVILSFISHQNMELQAQPLSPDRPARCPPSPEQVQ